MTDLQQPATKERETLDSDPYLLRPACQNCEFCDGLRDMGEKSSPDQPQISMRELFKSLSFFDRYLAIFIVLAMISGVLIGVYDEHGVRKSFNGAQLEGVSIPILIGLLVMMWPVLTKVQYETLPVIFSSRKIWRHIAISVVLNWLVAPFIMLAVAWATLPEPSLERERKGVILVGIARCIAMVLIWNTIAQGDMEYCAILVGVNSILQIVLFSPYALLFLNVLGGSTSGATLKLGYGHTAISVCIYLGIPLVAGIVTRTISKRFLTPRNFQRFLVGFGPLTTFGLLYTIVVLFANQGHRIIHNLGSVFRIFVPLILYFIIVWTTTFMGLYLIARSRLGYLVGGYDKVVVQAFTAGSNNFELAIAVAIASFGDDSPEALAATIGPLVEVPVLLGLSYVALFLRMRLDWNLRPAVALV